MHWVPYGPNALLFRFAHQVGPAALERSRALIRELEEHPPPGLIEWVPAFTTLLLEFDSTLAPDLRGIASALSDRFDSIADQPPARARLIEVPVVYDGPDLARLAATRGLAEEDVCRVHSSVEYRVYQLGFAPGFPYLGDLDPRLHLPRLATPRQRVRAGAVAIGGEHTGIYPVESPGGWNIIGHTRLKLFDPAAADPEAMFLFRPGDRVRFIPG
jgi:inhibitor of KinA